MYALSTRNLIKIRFFDPLSLHKIAIYLSGSRDLILIRLYSVSTRRVHFIHENLSVIKIERFHLVDKLTLKHCVIPM